MLAVILTIMKKGGYRRDGAGFTIVETLIVMAVTGIMFLAAVLLISGRTGKTQFITASNDLQEQLQQTINETTTGYFPNSGTFKCASGGAGMQPVLSVATQSQGTNGDCIFLGKAVQFGTTGSPDNYLVYSIAGNRQQSSVEVTSLPQANPIAIAPTPTFNGDITIKQPLENGLTAATMKYAAAAGATPTSSTTGFAVLTTFATTTASGSDCSGVCSGSQGLTLYAIGTGSTAINSQSSTGFTSLLNAAGAANYTQTDQIAICFNSGTTNQSAVYTIGGTGNAQSVSMQVQNGSCT
jgi:Tfp pilus assembly protein FimT